MKTLLYLLLSTLLTVSALGKEPLIEKAQKGWRYWDAAEAPAKTWYSQEFDDSKWKEGAAPLGYGKDAVGTTLSFGEDAQKKHPMAYARYTLTLEKASAAYAMSVRLDDGVVIYVNGSEIGRVNVPKGEVKTDAYSGTLLGPGVVKNESKMLLPAEMLKKGKNVIAVSIHQGSGSSSDLFLDLSLTGLSAQEYGEIKKETPKSPKTEEKPDKKDQP